jgi:hypothetical protein
VELLCKVSKVTGGLPNERVQPLSFLRKGSQSRAHKSNRDLPQPVPGSMDSTFHFTRSQAPLPMVQMVQELNGVDTVNTAASQVARTCTPESGLASRQGQPAQATESASNVPQEQSSDPTQSVDARARLTLAFQNVNGIAVKDEELVRSADSMGAKIIGVCETQLYSERTLCTGQDGKSRYRWMFGLDAERQADGRARGGVAFLIANSIAASVSLVKTSCG